ncbi:hypothetical protein JTE90_013415 [Oedothorax gibbosus]|uniref:Uncharacterized protein n=1 Tax=Oedothorax gibbosus TaxID=931172 RepID=A0AAV6TEI5_9ARAC|nr:hypothetical protein JTE90_013415 [Oedothorax gibbosus]
MGNPLNLFRCWGLAIELCAMNEELSSKRAVIILALIRGHGPCHTPVDITDEYCLVRDFGLAVDLAFGSEADVPKSCPPNVII